MLILPWLVTLLPTILRRILPFLVFFQDSPSGFQKIVLHTLCTGGFKVQLAGPLSMQQLWEDKLPAFIACELQLSAISKFLQVGRRSAGVSLFLIKIYNLALKVGVAVGFRQAAGLVLPILPGTSFRWKQEQLLQLQFPYTASADRDIQLILQGI